MILFKGITEPYHRWTGTTFQPNEVIDKFGKLQRGQTRECYIQTKWGQLPVPYGWMGKRIIIRVSDITETKESAKEKKVRK